MIEIIEHGKDKFDAVCPRCGCKFTYQLEDLKTYMITEFVDCPDCGKRYNHPQSTGTAPLKEQSGISCGILSMSKDEFDEKLHKAVESIYNEALHCHKSPAREIIDKLKEGKLPPLTNNSDFGIRTLK